MKVTAPTALLAMQAATVLAAPFAGGKSLTARQDDDDVIWTNQEGGFATVEYGDGKLNYGARVPSTILDVLRDECGQTSCNPSGGYGFSSLVVNSDRPNDASYTISVEGSFATDGERGSKAQLLELAKLGFEEVYNVGVAERRQGVIYIINECPAHQTVCPGKSSLAAPMIFSSMMLMQRCRSRHSLH
jgi:hypothetical protein